MLLRAVFSIVFGIFTSAVIATPSFEISLDVSKDELWPGAPLHLYLNVSRQHDKGSIDGICTISMYSRFDMSMEILDDAGQVVAQYPLESWYPTGHGFQFMVELASAETFRKTIVAHRWISTDLKGGAYTIRVELKAIHFHSGGIKGEKSEQTVIAGLPKDFEFPITILEPNKNEVRKEFQGFFDMARTGANDGNTNRIQRMAFDTIVFARGKLALPFQLALVRESYTHSHDFDWSDDRLLEMFRYIAHSGDADSANQLVTFAMESIFDRFRTGEERDGLGAWRFLDYAIRELHRTGDESIVQATSEYVSTVTPAKKIIPGSFMNGVTNENEDY